MYRERIPGRDPGRQSSTRSLDDPQGAPGKHTLTEGFAGMADASFTALRTEPLEDGTARAPDRAPSPASGGPRPTLEMLFGVPRSAATEAPQAVAANHTGMPDHLKSGLEALSGISLSDVRVHHDSARPPEVQARAYAKGSDIYLGPGQEPHLPHEGWHVVQQKQGRVQPTVQMHRGLPGVAQARGIAVNTDSALEREADEMGAKAASIGQSAQPALGPLRGTPDPTSSGVVQRVAFTEKEVEVALKTRAAAFSKAPYEIITPWDTEWGEQGGNCHGYTATGETHQSISGNALLSQLPDTEIVIFARDQQIAHSGRFHGGTLTHLLIGVGVLKSDIGQDLMGYERRFALPAERQELDDYLEAASVADARETEVSNMVAAVNRALRKGLEGATGLSERVFALQDDDDRTDYDLVSEEFSKYVKKHPEILEEDSEKSED